MNRFAFLIHPRDIEDLYRRFPLAKFLGKNLNYKIMKHLNGRLGFTVCSKFQIIHNQKKAEGYLIAVLLTAEQIMTLPSEFVRNRILKAVLYLQSLNVNVIGLGGLIKSVTHGGRWLVKKSEVIASITHGDTYSVVIAEEGVDKLIALKNLKNPFVAVVGAYGMIGSALSKILGRKYRLLLVGKNHSKLFKLSKQISGSNCKISTNLSATSSDSPCRIWPAFRDGGVKIFTTWVGDPFKPMRLISTSRSWACQRVICALLAIISPRKAGSRG